MDRLALVALLLSLVGSPALLAMARSRGADPLSVRVRSALWLIALAALLVAARHSSLWRDEVGLSTLGWRSLPRGLAAFVVAAALWPLLQRVQVALGGASVEETDAFSAIVKRPVSQRAFLVLTAGVTEEVLYRGYAIGVGAGLVGGWWVAATLSLFAFTVGHLRWGVSHLLSVLWVGVVMTLLFALTRDLAACMLAHTMLDAVGILVVPAVRATRLARGAQGAATG